MCAGRKRFFGTANNLGGARVFLRAGRKRFAFFGASRAEARSFAQTANCDILKYYA